MRTYLIILLSTTLLLSCRESIVESVMYIPTISNVSVHQPPSNVLSVDVSISAEGISGSVEIVKDSVLEQAVPFMLYDNFGIHVPIFGLHANTTYTLKVTVTSSTGQTATSDTLHFTTGTLPSGIPPFIVEHADSPTVRYVMLGIAPTVGGKTYAVIVDKDGLPVWYKEFVDGVVDFQQQPNGNYTAWASLDASPPHFYEFTVTGLLRDAYQASNLLETGPHELRLLGNSYALFGIEFRTMDLTAYGGSATANVRGIVVEYHRSGQQPLLWHTFDHFLVTDGASDVSFTASTVNPWHGNAIEIDNDDNLLVSFRNMDEITKINSQTGAIIWRLGGENNQFTFINDNLNGFSHQHGIRRLPNGNIILFDNGNLHNPSMSRAVEYKLDEVNKTAELVWEYRPDPPLYGFALGFAQRLSNGNTLVCFGTAQHIIEVDRTGRKRWELQIGEAQRFAYRAFNIESLY
jgi:hypothetical protein